MSKDTLWFPHDYHARNDDKTAQLILDHTILGYGVYMAMIEMLHEDENSRIEYSDKRIKRIAGVCNIPFEKAKSIVDDCLNEYVLFVLEDGFIVCDRVLRNKADRERIRQVRVENGRKGGVAKATKILANANQMPSNCLPLAKQNLANPSTIQDNTEHNSTSKEDIYISDEGIKNEPSDWKKSKREELTKMIEPYIEKYGKDLCNDFWYYWGQPHQKLKKLRYEGEKYFDVDARLRTFRTNANKQK